VLENLITEKLLEEESRKKGRSLDKVFQQEVDSKIPEPTDAEIQAYYLGTRQIQPLNEIKDLMRQQLKQAEIQHAREEFIRRLRQQADVAILLQPPRINISVDPTRLRGDPKAAITIVEFADYQCPYCRSEESVLKELLAKHPGKIKLAYRDFPLAGLHPDAQSAAEASRCAQEQGKFWEYHDALFAASRLGRDSEIEIAHRLALDIKQFESCLSSGKYKAQVERDLQDGKMAGINGTPGFFVDGINLSGSQSLSDFEKVIDSEPFYAKRARQ